jgi:hypothetical protein
VKRLILILVVVALTLTLVPLALAGAPGGGGWKHGHAKFNAVGKVTAVAVADTTEDPAAVSTITIKVQGGSHLKVGKHVKAMKKVVKPFNVAADAKVWQLTDDGAVAATLGDISAGDKVKVSGTVVSVKDEATGAVTTTFTITKLKYLDRTPDVAPAPEPSAPPVAE